TFVLNGTVNKQNCRYCTYYNTQYREKVNVWAGIINSQIIGLYFFDGTLTGARYLDFLQNFLVPELIMLFPDDSGDYEKKYTANIPQSVTENPGSAPQDRATPHFSLEVSESSFSQYMDENQRGQIEWPARFPDLTPLDYFLW
ncbi:hypothetical protein NQ318_022040, partial [Aromia moschata]